MRCDELHTNTTACLLLMHRTSHPHHHHPPKQSPTTHTCVATASLANPPPAHSHVTTNPAPQPSPSQPIPAHPSPSQPIHHPPYASRTRPLSPPARAAHRPCTRTTDAASPGSRPAVPWLSGARVLPSTAACARPRAVMQGTWRGQ
jgi:hypothetical protein